jgi:hypothetical protein
MTDLPTASYLITAIVTLDGVDGAAHTVRCMILGDDDQVLALSPEAIAGDPSDGEPVQLSWNAIERIEGGRVTVRCRVTDCGGSRSPAVRVRTKIAANRSE